MNTSYGMANGRVIKQEKRSFLTEQQCIFCGSGYVKGLSFVDFPYRDIIYIDKSSGSLNWG